MGRAGRSAPARPDGSLRLRRHQPATSRADMSLVTFPLKLPLLPVYAIVRLAQIIQDEAEREVADPATVRRALEQVEQARAAGEVSDEEAAELEKEALARFTRLRRGGTAAADGEGGDLQ